MSITGKKKALFVGEDIWVTEEVEEGKMLIRVGLTEHAQKSIIPIEFIRILPEGRYVARGRPFGLIESSRRIMLLRSPVTGILVKVNEKIRADPTLINKDPYGDGWLIVIKPLLYEEEVKAYKGAG